eukprot:SAG31_NODE_29706_length_391_cov_0.708904_1_plen_58_part_01
MRNHQLLQSVTRGEAQKTLNRQNRATQLCAVHVKALVALRHTELQNGQRQHDDSNWRV